MSKSTQTKKAAAMMYDKIKPNDITISMYQGKYPVIKIRGCAWMYSPAMKSVFQHLGEEGDYGGRYSQTLETSHQTITTALDDVPDVCEAELVEHKKFKEVLNMIYEKFIDTCMYNEEFSKQKFINKCKASAMKLYTKGMKVKAEDVDETCEEFVEMWKNELKDEIKPLFNEVTFKRKYMDGEVSKACQMVFKSKLVQNETKTSIKIVDERKRNEDIDGDEIERGDMVRVTFKIKPYFMDTRVGFKLIPREVSRILKNEYAPEGDEKRLPSWVKDTVDTSLESSLLPPPKKTKSENDQESQPPQPPALRI